MTKTVLIVEDNELNMKLFHDLLEAHGIDTIECSNGLEVLKIAREKKPDLILMDIQLPEVSGLDVTRWLKDDPSLKDIPVIAVTAFAMKGDEEKIREGGCEDYISKPISVTRFLDVIQKYLGEVHIQPPPPITPPAPAPATPAIPEGIKPVTLAEEKPAEEKPAADATPEEPDVKAEPVAIQADAAENPIDTAEDKE
jgi:two-component system cell cycle response regulator DivK